VFVDAILCTPPPLLKVVSVGVAGSIVRRPDTSLSSIFGSPPIIINRPRRHNPLHPPPSQGVEQIRDGNPETYWQSDGAQPHLINVQFHKKMTVLEVALYLDFSLDESYTPKRVGGRWGGGMIADVSMRCMATACLCACLDNSIKIHALSCR
jgi:hypothetical protein